METQHHGAGSSFALYIPLVLLAALLAIYLAGVFSLRRQGRSWSSWRTASFAGGLFLLSIALWPDMVHYAHQDIRGHMVQHLLIGMFAPLGLVLGAPVTLAYKTLPLHSSRIIATVLGSYPFHILSHPVAALLLNIGGMFVLYLTPLYNATLSQPFLHYLVHIHFLAAGYLYTWAIAGPDPAPRRPGFSTRMAVLFAGIAAHAFLSKFMYAYLYPLHSPHSSEQIQSAAMLMYYGGDLSELLLAVALYSLWYQKQKHPAYREGRLIT